MNIRHARRAMLGSCRHYGALGEKHEQNEPCRRYTTKEKTPGKRSSNSLAHSMRGLVEGFATPDFGDCSPMTVALRRQVSSRLVRKVRMKEYCSATACEGCALGLTHTRNLRKRPPKAKVTRSNRVGCASLVSPPKAANFPSSLFEVLHVAFPCQLCGSLKTNAPTTTCSPQATL
jgi:hypothetical protein